MRPAPPWDLRPSGRAPPSFLLPPPSSRGAPKARARNPYPRRRGYGFRARRCAAPRNDGEDPTSVIGFPVLPLAPLQAEPGDQDGSEQERDHGGGNGRAFAEVAAAGGALVAERRHQGGGIGRAPPRQPPETLE